MKNASEIEKCAAMILEELQRHGYSAYFVGGYVRDKLVKRPIRDIDIATSARPQQVQAIFEHTIPTGLQHGTVTVVIRNIPFEVTTYRTEGTYEDLRRPSSVEYIDQLELDLQRRDFTMNAMAMNQQGKIIDPFQGQHDLQAKLLRCVGLAKERFSEDALRMLRCIRFAADYELSIENATWEALLEHKQRLQYVAMERVRSECERMIEGCSPERAVSLLRESGLLNHVQARLVMASYLTDAGRAPYRAIKDPELRWAAFFKLLQCPLAELSTLLQRWTFSKRKKERIQSVLELQHHIQCKLTAQMSEQELRQAFQLAVLPFGRQCTRDWLDLMHIWESTWRSEASFLLIKQKSAQWIQEIRLFDRSQLTVNGSELAALSENRPGPWINELLQYLLQETALGRLENTPLSLKDAAQRKIKEWKPHE